LLLFVVHLENNQANYNRVWYQQHQENRFPYPLQNEIFLFEIVVWDKLHTTTTLVASR
jgi:hypothetical protein